MLEDSDSCNVCPNDQGTAKALDEVAKATWQLCAHLEGRSTILKRDGAKVALCQYPSCLRNRFGRRPVKEPWDALIGRVDALSTAAGSIAARPCVRSARDPKRIKPTCRVLTHALPPASQEPPRATRLSVDAGVVLFCTRSLADETAHCCDTSGSRTGRCSIAKREAPGRESGLAT